MVQLVSLLSVALVLTVALLIVGAARGAARRAGLDASAIALRTCLVVFGWLGRRALLAWNIIAVSLLANIVGTALTTMPGPLALDWPGPPATIVATWPFVWLPAFLVPVALFGHVLSLRQLFAPGASEPSGVASTRGEAISAATPGFRTDRTKTASVNR